MLAPVAECLSSHPARDRRLCAIAHPVDAVAVRDSGLPHLVSSRQNVCVPLPKQHSGLLHAMVDSTGLKVFGEGEWMALPCVNMAIQTAPAWCFCPLIRPTST